MKVGEEPLRSFSDLLQFYEAKRTDEGSEPAVETPSVPSNAASNEGPPVDLSENATGDQSPNASDPPAAETVSNEPQQENKQ